MTEVIRYEHVDISYKGKRVVHDVSFSVEKGEILGIVGESGSGKSTLIKAAMGLLGKDGLVTRGDIWYKGMDLPDLKPREMRKLCGPELGMIFQTAGSSFCPIRTVRAQLYEFMTEHKKIKADVFENQAKELLEKFGFEDSKRVLDSYPFELSGGMQQRVGIARAFVAKPKVIFADEPTGNLDSTTSRQVLYSMLEMAKSYGITFVMVTHEKELAYCGDRIVTIKDGRVLDNVLLGEDEKAENRRRLFGDVTSGDIAEPETTVAEGKKTAARQAKAVAAAVAEKVNQESM